MKRGAWYVAGIYFTLGILWIFISDYILLLLVKNPFVLSSIQTYKGWFFVLASSILIYLLARQKINKLLRLNLKHSENIELLESNKNKLLLATKSSNIGFWEWNLQTNEVFYSNEWLNQIGFKKNEISNSIQEWENRLHSENSGFIKTKLKEFLNGKIEQFDIEYKFKHKNNSFIWVIANAFITKNESEKPENLICTHIDITLRKKNELELQEKQQQLSTLIGNLNGIVYRCRNDENWTMLYLNDKIKEFTGYEKDELLLNKLRSFSDIIHPEDRANVNEAVQEAMNHSSKFQVSYRLNCKSGEVKWVLENGVGIFNESQELKWIEGYIIDITPQKLAEIALKKSEKKYRNLVENALIGVYSSDINGNFKYANKALCKILGYEDFKELESINTEKLYLEKESRIDLVKFLQKNQSVSNFELELITKHSEKINVILSASLVGNEMSGMMMDITTIKEYEAELIKSKNEVEKSSKIKDQFIGNVSHEIRTPLNAIYGFTNILKNKFKDDLDSRTGDFFQIIFDASQRLERTLDMMLDYSKLRAGDYEISLYKINLLKIIEKIIELHKSEIEKKKLEIIIENKINDVEIIADEHSLLIAISNLICNAIKYTEKGSVKITILRNEIQDLFLEIKDTGVGISEEFKGKIFQPYTQEEYGHTRQYEGIGLGLSIAKKQLELNGAEISFQSNKGAGSIFTIKFNHTFQEQAKAPKTQIIFHK